MFCLGKMSLRAAIGLVAVCGLGSSSSAFADTFQTYIITNTDALIHPVGVYSSGEVVLSEESPLSGNFSYDTYSQGVLVSSSPTSPTGPFSNGSACSVSFGVDVYPGICNGGYTLFGVSTINPEPQGVYEEHDGVFTSVSNGFYGIGQAELNASGDAVFDDLSLEQFVQVYNSAPTPEPGTWVLLLTGGGAAFAGQRKLFA